MKHFTSIKVLALMAIALMYTNTLMAGDGTKESPFTPAELNAQKDALAASGDTAWVKADLKGLGVDGLSTSNATSEDGTKNLAALFGDDSDSFVAYSWQILGELDLDELTNTEDLLIALTYQTGSHAYCSIENYAEYGLEYAEKNEPEELHFSLVEVEGALTVKIENGLLGYHVHSSYTIPENIVATTARTGYTAAKGAYVSYAYYDGGNDSAVFVTPKNSALVLMAEDGEYDLTLTTSYYLQKINNSNGLQSGKNAGVNTGTTKYRVCFRFISSEEKCGFHRNSDENYTVILEDKSEVFLIGNSKADHWYGNYAFETEAKDWITWAGGTYSEYKLATCIKAVEEADEDNSAIYNLNGQQVTEDYKGVVIKNGKKYLNK